LKDLKEAIRNENEINAQEFTTDNLKQFQLFPQGVRPTQNPGCGGEIIRHLWNHKLATC
jgi:hypothetical protein